MTIQSGIANHSIRDYWIHNLEKFPRKAAAIYEGQSHTFAECEELIENLRSHLVTQLGLKKGDTVAMAMPNCFEFYVAYWAVIKQGGVVVPVNIRLEVDGMKHIIGTSDAAVLISHSDSWETISAAAAQCENIKHTITVGFEEDDTTSFDSIVQTKGEHLPNPEIVEDDLAIIMHTSGTTGLPKGAMVTHGNLLFNVKNTIIAHGFRHEDVHLLVVPMFHCTGLYSMLPCSAYQGSTIVIAPRPQIGEVVDLIEQHRITTFLGVPTMFHFLTTMRGIEERDLSCLKVIGYAGSPMPVQTIDRLREKFPWGETRNFFGLTETISATHVLPSCDAGQRGDAVGKLLPDVGQRIIDDDGNDVPLGEVGELCFRKENVVQGYWKRPGLLEESMAGDWFNTGDYAMMDEDGYVYIRGRKKDMIIVGGENVYATEVESCILDMGAVHEVAVVGMVATGVRSYLGEVVKAVVVPREGAELSERDVKRHCTENLATYKVPVKVEFIDKLPRNPSGKVLKRELV